MYMYCYVSHSERSLSCLTCFDCNFAVGPLPLIVVVGSRTAPWFNFIVYTGASVIRLAFVDEGKDTGSARGIAASRSTLTDKVSTKGRGGQRDQYYQKCGSSHLVELQEK